MQRNYKHWLAGNLEEVVKEDDLQKSAVWLKAAGLTAFSSPPLHVQGALLLAPYRTWAEYYKMPEDLGHHYDDVVFSEQVSQRGYNLYDIAGRWHTHDHMTTEEEVRMKYLDPERKAPAGAADDAVRLVPLGDILRMVLDSQYRKLGRPLNILEAGSVRSETPEDGHSTLEICRWAHGRWIDVNFTSVDLDTSVAKRVLLEQAALQGGGYVTLVESDSREFLRKWEPGCKLKVVLLDSADDPAVALEEFKLLEPHLHPEAVVLIDDYKIKGQLAIPYAESKGWQCAVLDRVALLRKK